MLVCLEYRVRLQVRIPREGRGVRLGGCRLSQQTLSATQVLPQQSQRSRRENSKGCKSKISIGRQRNYLGILSREVSDCARTGR
ncbi:hypothetical protein LIA77_06775 [Sarocladium implicatum]|nr:hypothetical protein LIA77_06775 [Sarocladium implicatum]